MKTPQTVRDMFYKHAKGEAVYIFDFEDNFLGRGTIRCTYTEGEAPQLILLPFSKRSEDHFYKDWVGFVEDDAVNGFMYLDLENKIKVIVLSNDKDFEKEFNSDKTVPEYER